MNAEAAADGTGGGGLDADLGRAVPSENAAAFLLAVNGPHPGRVYPVGRTTVVLGRSSSADIEITHPSVSFQHARLVQNRAGFEIEDLGSTNGTCVRGERVERAQLRSGDRVMLGAIELSFLVDQAHDATMALLPPPPRPAPPLANQLARVIVGPGHDRYHQARAVRHPFPVERRELDDDQPLSLEELAGKVITGYRFLRPYLALMLGLAVFGLGVGVATAVWLPPAPVAIAEVRLQPAKKSNPVEGTWRASEEGEAPFFVQAERAFTHPALVGDTLKKLTGGEGQADAVAGRLNLEQIGERLYRATYKEPLLGRGRPDAVAFLGAHLRNYKDSEIDRALQALQDEAGLLKSKWAGAEKDLRQIDAELMAFKKENAGGLPETALQANASRFALEAQRAELRARIARLEGEVAADARQLASDTPLAQQRFSASQGHRESLAALQRKLNDLRSDEKGPEHPEVVKLQKDIAGVQKLIDEEMSAQASERDRAASAAHAQLSNRHDMSRAGLTAARRELREVESTLAQRDRLVLRMPEVAARLDDLQRRQEATKKLHDQFFQQYQTVSFQIDAERMAARSRVEMVTPPIVTSPTRARTLVQRGAMGQVLGLALVALVIAICEGRKLFSRARANLDGEVVVLGR